MLLYSVDVIIIVIIIIIVDVIIITTVDVIIIVIIIIIVDVIIIITVDVIIIVIIIIIITWLCTNTCILTLSFVWFQSHNVTTGLEASEFFLIGEGGSTSMAEESVSSVNCIGGWTGL